jgi:hypothetical protein
LNWFDIHRKSSKGSNQESQITLEKSFKLECLPINENQINKYVFDGIKAVNDPKDFLPQGFKSTENGVQVSKTLENLVKLKEKFLF